MAFIGTGVMGRWMAGHLLEAGYTLRVFNRTRAKAAPLIEAGARWCDSAGEAAAGADFVLTMVSYPFDVEAVYFDEGEILDRAEPGALLIDLTTSSPALAERIARAASERGMAALDAPVSGGDVGAKAGTLSLMVGGEAEAFERARPLFEIMGRNIVHQGDAGAGQRCKLVNQIAIAGTMLGLCEALTFAKASGLDCQRVLDSISQGAAGSVAMDKLAPRMLAGDFEPGFYVKHFIKDLGIALDSAYEMGLSLPGLAQAHALYMRLATRLDADDQGTQALIRLYDNPAMLAP